MPDADWSLRWVRPAPSNMPPHHLSWWTETALRQLAQCTGLDVERVLREPLEKHHFEHLVYRMRAPLRGESVVGNVPGSVLSVIDQAESRGAGWLVRGLHGLGVGRLRAVRGHSVLVVLTKPADA